MVAIINNPYQWRIRFLNNWITYPSFGQAWAHAQLHQGWERLQKPAVVGRLAGGQNRICIAWRQPDEQILLEWF